MKIMRPEDYRYTWTIPATPYVRFFLWVYDIERDKLTLCRFFWGNLLMIIALPLRVVSLPLGSLAGRMARKVKAADEANAMSPTLWISHRRAIVGRTTKFKRKSGAGYQTRWLVLRDGDLVKDYVERSYREVFYVFEEKGIYEVRVAIEDGGGTAFRSGSKSVRVYAHPVPPQRLLEAVGYVGTRGVGLVQRVSSALARGAWRARRVVLVGSGILLTLGLACCVYIIATSPVATWHFAAPVLGGIGLAIGVLSALAVLVALATGAVLGTRAIAPRAARRLRLRSFGRGVKHGGLTFGQAMKLGYVAVKSNTCPRLVVEGDEAEEAADREEEPVA